MKRIIALLLSCVCLLFLACCGKESANDLTSNETENILDNEEDYVQNITPIPQDECRLIVNGKDITENTYVCIDYNTYTAEIPVLAVFRELGHNAEMQYVEETDSYVAVIDQEIILLDTQYQDYGIYSPLQSKYVRKIENDDFIVDSYSLSEKVYWPFNVRIEIDFNSGIVYINSFDIFDCKEYQGVLIVNGKDITKDNHIKLQEYDGYTDAAIPFLAIVSELGAKFSWENESIVVVTYKGSTETYDVSDSDFGVPGREGSVYTREVVNGDLIFDATSIEGILSQTYNARIKIDEDNCIVYIDSIK